MGPGAAVIGKVVSRATSLPIEGVQVCPEPVIFSEGQGHVCPHTDADGEFALYGLLEAEYWIELRTEGDVNFVEATARPDPTHAGGTVDLEASLVPGFEIEGTVTEAGTGKPVGEAIPLPRDGTLVCAVDAVTEARVKCTGVEDDGSYSIPGLPPGRSVGVTFGVDYIAEGFDLGMDGYVRRYWDEVPTWGEAVFISGSGSSNLSGIDAALTQGEEVFPRCEVKTACATPAPPTTVMSPPSIPVAPVTSEPNPFRAEYPTSPTPARLPAVHCKAGFRRVVGSPRAKACVKVDRGYQRKSATAGPCARVVILRRPDEHRLSRLPPRPPRGEIRHAGDDRRDGGPQLTEVWFLFEDGEVKAR